MNTLESMFAPRSLAVIGASRRDGTLGKMFLDAVVAMEYKGHVYPVNPKAHEINGLPCFPDIESLPESPDLAVILIPRDYVLDIIDQLALKSVKNVVVISAGFRETGTDGAALEKRLLEKLTHHNMRMIGPNSMGLFNTNPEISLNATFSPTRPKPGHVAFISQSGALGVAVLELSKKIGLGFSVFVSTGNKADIGDVEVLEFAANDTNTSTIIFYQEAIDHPQEFRRALSKIIPYKPVLTLKSGRTQSGERAASSHTGALASDDRLVDAFLKQCGVIRCENLQELLDSAHAFASQPLPAGNNVAVVTNAGGPGILASDALESNGLELPALSDKTVAELTQFLPAEAGLKNPVDMIASANHDTYRDVCEILEADDNIDALLIIIVKPPVATTAMQITRELDPLISNSTKPFLFVIMADTELDGTSNDIMNMGVPVFTFPYTAARALGNMVRYSHIRQTEISLPNSIAVAGDKTQQKSRQLNFEECAKLLSEYGIPVTPNMSTSDIKEAQHFLAKHENVAIKVADEKIIHKSDLGLVQLNISTPEQMQEAFLQISQNLEKHSLSSDVPSFLLQKMYPAGVEMILGSSKDPSFGLVIMFGVGGIFVELYQDIVFKVLPVTRHDTRALISEIKAEKLLEGFRGLPKVDKKVLSELIYALGNMIQENTQITEMDINPLLWPAGLDHPVVVDCRITVTDSM